MNRRKVLLPIVVLLGASLTAAMIVVTAPQLESVDPEQALPVVRVLDPQPQSVPLWVRSQGTVAPRTESELVPEVSGPVVWTSPALVSGGFFRHSEALLKVDPRDYEAAVARARASLRRAESEAEYASSELARQQGLARSNANSASQLASARRSHGVGQAALVEARVALDQAKRDLDRTTIRAPYAGRVRDERVDVGQFVNRGAAIATLYAIDYAEVRLPVADHQLAYLDLPAWRAEGTSDGPRVRLHARFAGREHEWDGRVVRTEGAIDPRTRMVHVVARVEDPYGALRSDVGERAVSESDENESSENESSGEDAGGETGEGSERAETTTETGLIATADIAPPETTPWRTAEGRPPLTVGLFVSAEIAGPIADGVLVLPRHALRDGERVLVVDREDRLRLRDAEVIRIERDEVLIRNALGPGERICVSPMQVVVEGMKVRPYTEVEA